jgi:5'-deoxynucleotidase YfbR-like HD superfamily hydrolase
METLEFIRNAGETRRFHTVPILRVQNVAEHSWHVVQLLWYLWGGREPGISIELLMAAMNHDAAEHIVGDVPAPAKRNMGELLGEYIPKETFRDAWGLMEENILKPHGMDWDHFLSDDQRDKLKFCDALDGMLYCVREREMGNQLIGTCFQNFHKYCAQILSGKVITTEVRGSDEPAKEWDLAWDTWNYAVQRWSEVNGNS